MRRVFIFNFYIDFIFVNECYFVFFLEWYILKFVIKEVGKYLKVINLNFEYEFICI